MAKKFLGKVAAGTAAAAGAFLLVATPGVAQAATQPDGRHDKGCIITYPKVVKPGHEVKIIAKCKKPQDKPWVWSEVTGKVWLKPWTPPKAERPEPLAGPDGGMVDGKGHKDGIDPRRADASAPTDSSDNRTDGRMNDGRSHKDGVYSDGEQSSDSWFGREDDGQKMDEHGSKDGVKVEGQSGDSWSKMDDGRADGRMNDGRSHKDGVYSDGEQSSDSWFSREDDGQKMDEHGSKDGVKVDGHKTFVYWGEAKVDWHAKPGRYWIKGSCGYGRLIVAPKGWVDGGDGGSTGANTGLAAGGATALAAAAVGGIALVRRRRTDGSLA